MKRALAFCLSLTLCGSAWIAKASNDDKNKGILVEDDIEVSVSYGKFQSTVVDDTDPPVPDTFFPSNGGTEVSREVNPQVTWNESVQLGSSGTVAIIDDASGNTFFSADVSGGSGAGYSAVADKMTELSVPGTLEAGRTYYVRADGATTEDLAGNTAAGFGGPLDWSFTTIDDITPTPTAFSPANGSVDVATDQLLRITWSEALNSEEPLINSIPDNTIAIVDQSTNEVVSYVLTGTFGVVAGTLTYEEGNTVTALNPYNADENTTGLERLRPATTYYVESIGVNFIDGSFNEAEGFGAGDWSFTTETALDAARDLDHTMELYPNPTAGLLTLEFNRQLSDPEISVWSISGKSVDIETKLIGVGQYQVDFRESPEGLYFIRIQDGEFEITRRVMKIK